MKIYRVTDHHTGEVFYADTAPHVRRYKMTAEYPDLVTSELLEYDYKYQIVVLLNDALKTGMELAEKRYEAAAV